MPSSTELDLTLRPAALEEADLAADLATAYRPDWPMDPVQTRWEWEHPDTAYVHRRYIVEAGGRPVGYSHTERWEPDPEAWAVVEPMLLPSAATRERLVALYRRLSAEALEGGALKVMIVLPADRPDEESAAAAAGFRAERVDRAWELDLVEHGERLRADAHAARARMRQQAIDMKTLADAGDAELRAVHAMAAATWHDIPHSVTTADIPFEDWRRWFDGPNLRRDRYWVAWERGRPVAVSFVIYPPVRGIPETGYTAVARTHRGRGIARAIKLQTLAQAIELGATAVRTDNDSENAPMLHINETLGYRPIPGWVEMVLE